MIVVYEFKRLVKVLGSNVRLVSGKMGIGKRLAQEPRKARCLYYKHSV